MIWFSWHRTYFSLFFISWFTASRQKMNSLHFVLLNQGRMEKTGLIIFYSNPTYRYHLSLSPVRSDMSAISYWGGGVLTAGFAYSRLQRCTSQSWEMRSWSSSSLVEVVWLGTATRKHLPFHLNLSTESWNGQSWKGPLRTMESNSKNGWVVQYYFLPIQIRTVS